MNRLAQILPPEHVVVDLDITSKKRAFERIGLLFESTLGLSRAEVTQKLFAREQMGSTGIGQGVALPHGCLKSIKTPLAAVVRLAHPIPFEADDDLPVQLMIVLLVPENQAQRHLDTLSQVAEMLGDASMREALLHCPDAQSLYRQVCDWRPLAEVS